MKTSSRATMVRASLDFVEHWADRLAADDCEAQLETFRSELLKLFLRITPASDIVEAIRDAVEPKKALFRARLIPKQKVVL